MASILSEEQKEMSMLFVGQIKEKREVEFKWMNKLPVINHALVNFTCNVYASYTAGNHTLYVGEVTDFSLSDGNSLSFFEGQYIYINKLTQWKDELKMEVVNLDFPFDQVVSLKNKKCVMALYFFDGVQIGK